MSKRCVLFVALVVLVVCPSVYAEWQPAKGALMTRWAANVGPDNAHPQYPRPQMVRKDWLNLNGLWEYAISPEDKSQPKNFDGQILVPFCVESSLSGVAKPVGKDNRLWYRRIFAIPDGWDDKRVLLHLGAVDWEATVWVNGKKMGTHQGGYDPFSFDITDALKSKGKQEIVVSVQDPEDDGSQPRGKQVKKPAGIWYTSVTGIWQTVWLEPVPKAYIKSLKITPDIDTDSVSVLAQCPDAASDYVVEAEVKGKWILQGRESREVGREIAVPVKDIKLWSPSSPFLYDLKVTLKDGGGNVVDSVSSYFGMRKISLGKDRAGITRICLNNKPLFQYGPLDQGWWPDGLYTAPTDEALRYDIEVTKKLGFNMLRKHVKVEPARLYYWCDKMGLLVWQDMPSGFISRRVRKEGFRHNAESKAQFKLELKRMIDALGNHPSIVIWVPFNEGWGQFDTTEIVKLINERDRDRLVINASGWTDDGSGDIHDIHSYPGPVSLFPESDRAVVIGEFGGLGLPVKDHLWQDKKNWGYRSFSTRTELTEAYLGLIRKLRPLIDTGLSAAIYTQTTDVEIEVNGLMTYDRAMIKIAPDLMVAAHRNLYARPMAKIKTIVPMSDEKPIEWWYTTKKPADNWYEPDFDDSEWQKGQAPFGSNKIACIKPRTTWDSEDIWMRRTFELSDTDFANPHLSIQHHGKEQVYLNGNLLVESKLPRHFGGYVIVPPDKQTRKMLKAGANTMAVHSRRRNERPCQHIDAGFIDIIEPRKE